MTAQRLTTRSCPLRSLERSGCSSDRTRTEEARSLIALTSRDLDTDATRAVSLGATNEGRHEENGFEWVDMRDPEGNRFTFNAPPPN